ncbi:MAG TPA: tetratricopeptide repeat protein [Isosphaeraceae bacterium]|nr:tetratricopeptide repeat protein [Isosphaeraceae bacterium]
MLLSRSSPVTVNTPCATANVAVTAGKTRRSSMSGPVRSTRGTRRDRRWRPEAESYFRRALDVARRQGAKSLELRAALSLARLLRERGRPVESRQLVAEPFGWFTEGWDTPDLQDARTLLEDLA